MFGTVSALSLIVADRALQVFTHSQSSRLKTTTFRNTACKPNANTIWVAQKRSEESSRMKNKNIRTCRKRPYYCMSYHRNKPVRVRDKPINKRLLFRALVSYSIYSWIQIESFFSNGLNIFKKYFIVMVFLSFLVTF